MLDIVFKLFDGLWTIFKYPVYAFIGLLVLYFVLLGFFVFFDYVFKKRRFVKGSSKHVFRPSFFNALFGAIKQKKEDIFNANPDFFRYQGLIIFTGRQGSGKTISMVEEALRYKKEYPLSRLITNLSLKKEDDELNHWRKLVDYKNGIFGVICCLDEMQNWFSSNQSKDFPPEMLQVITQNRKNRRVIFGTAQTFNRLSKPIREQATEVRECHTLAGVFTFVVRKEPFLDSNGDVERWKVRGFYYFAHTKKLRDSYDTYKVIDSLSESGFKPVSLLENSITVTNIEASKNKRRAR